jgi:peroxiredoxin
MLKHTYTFILFSLFNTVLFAQRDNPDAFLRKKDSLNRTFIGTPYPDFEYTSDDGIIYSKKKLLGKRYYINFWFEACHPCMDEMNSLILLNDKLKGSNNEFISFTFDPPATVRRLREEKNLNFIIIPVSRDKCDRLNFNNGFPKHIVVDEKGNVEYISFFFKSNEETIKEITALLTNKSTVQ